jgi:serine/threonine-protein kinase
MPSLSFRSAASRSTEIERRDCKETFSGIFKDVMGLEPERARDGPTVVGRYALYDKIASGGMATVHLGRLIGPIGFSRTVAIKRMLPQFVSDPGFVSMFVDEARMASRIRHPNVVPTLDVVAEADELFLVLEYVHGETLSQLIKAMSACEGRIPPHIAAGIVCGMLHGLHSAHHVKNERGEPLGLVHRDVSPQNVLVGTDGVARLLDFGVAKATGRMQVTTKGQVKGKLAYMAPEQVRGTVTPKSDVYSASAVLWEALTCHRLFQNVTWQNVTQIIMEREVAPPSAIVPQLSRELDAIVLKGLEKDPDMRFESALDMALAIERCMHIAPAHEIGEWVTRTASGVLAVRAQKIADIESRASDDPAATLPVEGSPTITPADEPASEVATRRDNAAFTSELATTDEATENNPGTPFTQTTPSQQMARDGLAPAGRGRAGRAVLGVAAVAVCAAMAVVAVRRVRRSHHGYFEQSAANAAAQPNPTPPSTEVTAPAAPSARPASTPTEPAGIAVTDLPVASSTPEPTASAAPHPTKRSRPAQLSKRPDCNPPYTLDENHIRRIKPQCL